jgi:hypothetical protein
MPQHKTEASTHKDVSTALSGIFSSSRSCHGEVRDSIPAPLQGRRALQPLL